MNTAPVMMKYSIASSGSSRQSGRSFSRTLTTSSTDSYSEVIPENLSFEELNNVVESLLQVITQIDLENQIFQAYLEYHSPKLIADMDETLEAMTAQLLKIEYNDHRRDTIDSKTSYEDENTAQNWDEVIAFEEQKGMIKVTHKMPSKLARLVNLPSTISIRQTKSISFADSFYQRQQLSAMVRKRIILNFERSPRMNFAQRIDVSEWATEQQQQRLKAAVDRATIKGGLLRAQIEARGMRITETRKMLIHFNAKFQPSLFHDDKPLYADYFVKDIRDTVTNLDAIIERIRLKLGQLKCHRRKLLADLALKRELSESIRPVDIATLKIENEQLTQNIALKTKHLNDLKTVSGHATQKVNSNKKRLVELTQTLKNLQNEILRKRSHIATMEQETAPQLNHERKLMTKRLPISFKERTDQYYSLQVVHEAQKAERALTKIRERIGKFTAPEVVEYVQLKRDIRDLTKQMSSLKRRYYLRSLTASDLRRRVKYLQQRKSMDYTSETLKEPPLKLDSRGRNGHRPERNMMLTCKEYQAMKSL